MKNVISVVGAGGKTSTIKSLSRKFSENNSILISTTTKMSLPNKEDYDYLMIKNSTNKYILKDKNDLQYELLENIDKLKGKITYYLPRINSNKNKFMHISENEIGELKEVFDVIFLESDGAKGKTLKANKKKEPVISKYSAYTIAILDLSSVGLKINDDNIYNVKKFMKITDTNINDSVNLTHIYKIIMDKNGLFKNSVGKKILILNKIRNNKSDMEKIAKIKRYLANEDILIYTRKFYAVARDK